MSEQDNEELDSKNETSEEDDNTEDIEEVEGADADETEDEDKPKYTETEMKLYARTKKAEAEARKLKKQLAEKDEAAKPKIKTETKTQESSDSVDEKILRETKGYDDDAMDELKFIAAREGISIFAAQHSKRFATYQKQADEEKRKAEASAGGSKGSGRKKSEPSFSDPNLTEEQHRKMAEDKYGVR
jgi:hypothetical protein